MPPTLLWLLLQLCYCHLPTRLCACSCVCAQPGVAQLLHEVSQLEKARQLLDGQQLLALTEDLARLNDTYIVAVSSHTYSCCCNAVTMHHAVSLAC